MSIDIEAVRSVALSARADFEQNNVAEDEMIEASIAFDWVYFAFRGPSSFGKPAFERQLAEGTLRRIGRHVIPVPLFLTDENTFPNGYCNIASPVVAHRLVQSNVLGDHKPELVHGGYGEGSFATDYTSSYSAQHTFVNIGNTPVSTKTIVDITADQFDPGVPAVYVGPIEYPWTDNPRFATDGY